MGKPDKKLSPDWLPNHQIEPLIIITTMGTLVSKTSTEYWEPGIVARLTSKDSFTNIRQSVTSYEESVVTLAHQLHSFGAIGHKFFKIFGDTKRCAIQATVTNTLRLVSLA